MPRLVRGGFLLGWPQTELPLTPQPARKLFNTKDSKMSSSPPTSLQTNGTGMRSERNPPPTRPLNSFTYLRAHSGRGVDPGNKKCSEAKWSLGVERYVTRFDRPLPAFSFFVSLT